MFVEKVQVNDPMSEEEKEMILNVCKNKYNMNWIKLRDYIIGIILVSILYAVNKDLAICVSLGQIMGELIYQGRRN